MFILISLHQEPLQRLWSISRSTALVDTPGFRQDLGTMLQSLQRQLCLVVHKVEVQCRKRSSRQSGASRCSQAVS